MSITLTAPLHATKPWFKFTRSNKAMRNHCWIAPTWCVVMDPCTWTSRVCWVRFWRRFNGIAHRFSWKRTRTAALDRFLPRALTIRFRNFKHARVSRAHDERVRAAPIIVDKATELLTKSSRVDEWKGSSDLTE